MHRIAKRLARLPVAERRKIEGIGPRRAEIIVAGAQVYYELLERLHLQGFRYSPLGLRDGILAQMAADYDRSTARGRQIESERWESILKCGRTLSCRPQTCARRAGRGDASVYRIAVGAPAASGVSRNG